MSTDNNTSYNKEDILGIECKHAVYTKANPSDRGAIPDDLIFIKEVIHLKDGRLVPNTRMLVNYQRPFWITKPGFRNHDEYKESEKLERLDKFECTQAALTTSIKKALKLFTPAYSLKMIADHSPYIYGADISSTAMVKRKYMERYPDCRSQNRVAILDIETDVIHGTDDPIFASISFKDKAILAVTKQYLENCPKWDYPLDEFDERIQPYMRGRIPDTIKDRNLKIDTYVADNPLDMIKKVIGWAHEHQPDFLAIWNMDFDIPRILQTIEKYHGDAGDIFSDPSVPKQFRKVWYKKGSAKKVTANGKEMALPWTDQWHTLFCPASFYVIDQACVFRQLRVAKGREPSYALDAILQKYTKTKKLKNKEADHMSGLEWHQHMQVNEPLDYGVYNLYDCISCEILDEEPKVGDLRQSISVQIGHSDYEKFNSQPRRTVDDLHFVYMDEGEVIGVTPKNIRSEFDDMVVNISNWIVTLPAHMVEENGIQCIVENPELRSMIRVATYDLDVSAAYPNGQDILNASKRTTIAEVVKIRGVDEHVKRAAGLNLTSGTVNATEICCSVMKAPTFAMLVKDFETHELNK